MREMIQKPLALLLSASLLSAYAMPISAAERIVVDNGETYSAAHSEIAGLNNPEEWGGAIYNRNGILKVEDVTFSTNIGYSGGAIAASTANTNETSIVNARFENNHARYDGGAIGNFSAMTISGSKFIGNTAQLTANAEGEYTEVAEDSTPIGGGAISFGAVSASKVASIKDTLFQNNISGTNGGAIATRLGKDADNSAATLDIAATFDGNKAYQHGGAIYNTFYTNNGLDKGDGVTVTGEFTNNQADENGGAIYNDGAKDKKGNPGGVMSISTAQFAGNSAKAQGGAIYNSGILSVDNATFKDNTAFEGGAIYARGQKTYGTDADLAVTKISNSSFTNNSVTGEYLGGAVVAGRNSKVIINNSTFESNKAESGWGGALYSYASASDSKGGIVEIADSSFTNNEALAVGAAGFFSDAKVTNVTFSANKATAAADDGGGAVFLGSVSKTSMENVTFTENTSAAVGGAIATRSKQLGNNEAAFLDIMGSSFTKNAAGQNGGAIYNTFYHSQADENSVYVANSNFTENAAKNGGAIYNAELLDSDKDKQVSAMTVKNGVFSGNTATENGGAVYNAGIFNLQGDNIFSGNTAGGNANDIYNLGTLNIADGKTVLEGGVTGTGEVNVASGAVLDLGLSTLENSAVTFASGSTLGVTLASDQMGGIKAGTVTVGDAESDQAKLLVTLSKDFLTDTTGVTKQLTNGTEVTNGSFAMADVNNALYTVSFDAQTNEVTAVRKSQEEQNNAIAQAGGNGNNAAVINAFTSSADLGSDAANQTADIINQLAQTDTAAAVRTAKALAPEEASEKQVIHGAAARQLFSAIDAHINTAFASAPRTYALADDNQALYNSGKNYSVWAQGLVNKSHKEETSASAFTGRSTGLAGGADMKLGEDWIAGLGYAYLHTNVDSFNRHERILGDNFFLYGQYRPGRFFVQGAFTYGDSKYEEDKYLPGLTVDADYHVKSYAANLSAGYELNEWLTPMLGLRYMSLQSGGYTDSSDQAVSAEQDNYLTGILGAKLQREYRLAGLRLLPQINAGVAYDFVSDGNDSSVSLPNGAAYDVAGERLHRLSFETGASVAALVSDNVEVALAYDGNFRRDYNSHTGSLKLRYMF